MNNRFQNEVQEAIEIHNMVLGLDSLDVEAAFARVISYLKTDSRSLKLQILLALNYAIFWRPSKSNHFEMIIRNIIPILSSSDFSHEQLKYEIFPSKQFTKLINKKSKSKTTETETKTEKTPTLIEIIKLDDVLSFQDILSQSNIDIDDSVTSSDEFNVFLRELHGIKKSKNESKLLNLAAFYGSINIFKFLWMNNATISSTITNYAVIGGNYDMIHLIEKIPFQQDDLYPAVIFHRNDIVEYLINNFQITADLKSLKFAVKYNNIEFFSNNLDVFNYFTHNELSLNAHIMMNKAIKNHNITFFKLIYSKFGIENEEDFKELMKNSILKKSLEIFKFLVCECGDKYNHIFSSIKLDDILQSSSNIIKILYDKKIIDINTKTFFDSAAFSIIEIVEYINNNFTFDKFENNETPLHSACNNGNIKVVKYLCGVHKEWINMKDDNGVLPIHNAAMSNNLKVLEFLIHKMKCNPNSTDNEMRTALHYAVEYRNIENIKFLCSLRSIDINMKIINGQTPLEMAYENNYTLAIDTIKNRGGKSNIFADTSFFEFSLFYLLLML